MPGSVARLDHRLSLGRQPSALDQRPRVLGRTWVLDRTSLVFDRTWVLDATSLLHRTLWVRDLTRRVLDRRSLAGDRPQGVLARTQALDRT